MCLLGQIVNNCVTDNAKLPLSAAQGKVLMDLYNVLNTKSQNIGKYEDTITLINNKINTMLPPGKKIIPVISFSVKRTGLYLCHPNIRFQCPSGYNVTFKISESTNTEYELGAYEDSFVISPCGYCSSGYGKPKVLEVGKTYYILAQTTYTEAITLEYMSATVILIKEYL